VSSPLRVALATATGFVDDDVDLPHLLAALRDRDVYADAVPWDDPRCDWSAFGVVVIRSTWDYFTRLREYLAWTERVARTTTLRNPAHVVRWNSDKRYLASLRSRGLPVVPTRFLSPGDTVVRPELADFVVKPVVSAGAHDTARYTGDQWDTAEAHVQRLHAAGSTVMVQPYLPEIVAGERALVFLAGRYSHAILKGPVLVQTGVVGDELVAHPDPTGYVPAPAELDLAQRVLECVPAGPDELLYARVDLVRGADGSPVLMELELIEPNLFLGWSDGGPQRLADAVIAPGSRAAGRGDDPGPRPAVRRAARPGR
jgi:hypothetical protein